jgi:hypothetical protein
VLPALCEELTATNDEQRRTKRRQRRKKRRPTTKNDDERHGESGLFAKGETPPYPSQPLKKRNSNDKQERTAIPQQPFGSRRSQQAEAAHLYLARRDFNYGVAK